MKSSQVGVALIGAGVALGALGVILTLRKPQPNAPALQPTTTPVGAAAVAREVAVVIYDHGLQPGWDDWGWGQHDLQPGRPAKVSFQGYGGIVFRGPEQKAAYGSLIFQVRTRVERSGFLAVGLLTVDKAIDLPVVPIRPEWTRSLADGWRSVEVPWQALNASGAPFDRVVIKAISLVDAEPVELDHVALTRPAPSDATQVATRSSELKVWCDRAATPISPLIYGVAGGTPGLGASAVRLGGNPMSRFNWALGNVWNTGSDWFFENVRVPDGSLDEWIDGDVRRDLKTALVVPMLGWVAKDTSAVGFPVSKLGPQKDHDPKRPEAGNGVRPDGTLLTPLPPTQTSTSAPPELIGRWVRQLRDKDRERGKRGVDMYILDNEPTLWNKTHRDVHPDPLTYDELLDRTIRYGTAIREADPDVTIAGPAEWGWTGYFFSALDSAAGWVLQPDRLAHGGVPLLPWYLGRLAAHEKESGVRILDVVDVHFYPQAEGVYGARVDRKTRELRLRSTRALWDPSYRDESWINEPVNLIPRLRDWIQKNYPGRGISIGEWSFGADSDISGGLAILEALGRFGQQGLRSAFYWTAPAKNTPGYWAFRAFRDFDGKGARFLDLSVPTAETEDTSLFASRDADERHLVLVVLNRSTMLANRAKISLPGCGRVIGQRIFDYAADLQQITEEPSPAKPQATLETVLPPFSFKVIDLVLEPGPR